VDALSAIAIKRSNRKEEEEKHKVQATPQRPALVLVMRSGALRRGRMQSRWRLINVKS